MTSEKGHAAAEFALAVGVLMLPVALVILSFGPWLDTRVTAEAAAAEGVRAAVLSLDQAVANRVLADVVESSGSTSALTRVGWCGNEPAVSPSGWCTMTRGSVIEVDIEVWTPLFSTPWGSVGGLWVGGHHAEPIDLYRSLP